MFKNRIKNWFNSPFIKGMGSIFNLGGNYYPKRKILSDKEAWEEDYKALKSDWDLVGKDMWTAIKQFDKEHNINSDEIKRN